MDNCKVSEFYITNYVDVSSWWSTSKCRYHAMCMMAKGREKLACSAPEHIAMPGPVLCSVCLSLHVETRQWTNNKWTITWKSTTKWETYSVNDTQFWNINNDSHSYMPCPSDENRIRYHVQRCIIRIIAIFLIIFVRDHIEVGHAELLAFSVLWWRQLSSSQNKVH